MDDFFSLQYLINCTGRFIRKEKALKKKDVFIYFFCSSKCSPGNDLLPKLKTVYEEAKKRHCPVEIIYVSSDTDAAGMLRHFKEEHHGWYAVPINEVTVTEMHWKYNITFEPQIVVVRRNGDIVTRKGKEDLLNLGINVLVKWLVPIII